MSRIEFVKLIYPKDTLVTIEGDRQVISEILKGLEGKFMSIEIGERFDVTDGWSVKALKELLNEENNNG